MDLGVFLLQTLSVEFYHVNEGAEALNEFMASQGYVNVYMITDPGGLANDFMYIHSSQKDLLETAKTVTFQFYFPSRKLSRKRNRLTRKEQNNLNWIIFVVASYMSFV